MNAVTRRTILVIVVGLVIAAGAFALEYALSHWPDRQFGHSQAGHTLGWIGLALCTVVFAYPAQKRLRPNRVWSKPWLHVHEVFGILGPMVVLVHTGAHMHALVPVLALVTLGLVVLSGIVGAGLHSFALRSLNAQHRELAQQGFTEEQIETRLHELATQEGILRWWPWVHVPLTAAFVVLTLLHVVSALYFGGI